METLREFNELRAQLSKFDRSQILEVYFARADGRFPDVIPEDSRELYEIELEKVKTFLLNQQPQDPLLSKLVTILQ